MFPTRRARSASVAPTSTSTSTAIPNPTSTPTWTAAALAGLLVFANASPALADPPARDARVPDIDARGAIQVGGGRSELLRGPVLAMGFHDEFSIARPSRATTIEIFFGMHGQRGPAFTRADGEERHKGFLGLEIGTGVMLRPVPGGASVVLGLTSGPTIQSGRDGLDFDGFGVTGHAELFPFYQSLAESVECRRGTVATYVLSGLHGWAIAREDWMGGVSGPSWAAGAGVDLARNALLPVLGAVFQASCSGHQSVQ